MLPGPTCSIELVTSARRARYYVLRVLFASVMLLTLFATHASWNHVNMTDIATVANFTNSFFLAFGIVQLMTVLLMGPAMVAGTIAVERERRTIEYLFTSTLSNAEIVLGKLTARFVHIAYLVLAGLPVLALAMLLGGIAPDSLVILSVVTLSTMVAVAAISVAISVWSARAREAVIRTYLVMIVLLILPVFIEEFQLSRGQLGTWVHSVNHQLFLANPLYVFGTTVTSHGTMMGPWELLGVLLRNHMIASVVTIAMATLAVRRVHLRRSGKGSSRRRRWRWQLFRAKVGNRPMLWKEMFAEPAAARLGLLGYAAIMLIVLAILSATVMTFYSTVVKSSYGYGSGYGAQQYIIFCTVMGTVVSCGGLLLMAARAASCITSEKERECWDSLLGTPLEATAIIHAKVIGNLWAMRGVLLLLLVLYLPGALIEPKYFMALPFVLGTLLLMALYAATLGVLMSLRLKNSLRAMAATLAIGIVGGGGYFFCCIPFMIGPGHNTEIILAACIPFLLAFPGITSVEGLHHDETVMAAYVIGVIGYLVATIVLYSIAVGQFDSLTGRTHSKMDDWGPLDQPESRPTHPRASQD